MKSFSLKRRIGLCIAVLVLFVISTISVIAYREFQEALLGSLDAKLKSDLNTVRYLLFTNDLFSPDTEKEVRSFLNPQKQTQDVRYQVRLEDSEDLMESLATMDIIAAMQQQQISPPKTDDYILSNMTQGPKTYRVIWARYPVAGNGAGCLNIALAASSVYAYHEVEEFMQVLFIFGGIILWITLGLTGGILKWGLKPIDSLAHRMSGVSGSNLGEVSREFPNTPNELQPFVTAWDEMLNKIEHVMNEQKRFTSDAAHELRTPVTLIKSTLQLAQSQDRSVDFYRDTIAKSLEDLDRLNALIEQLLQLSHLENGDTIQRDVIDLNDLVRDVAEQYEPLIRSNDYQLLTRLSAVTIDGNPHQIRQLMLNLIDNAVKYGPPKTTITLSVERHDDMAVITVHDEGGTIPKEECGELFERFYRVHKARDRNSGGSGLGLAIAKEIVALHAGTISVESDRQKGTDFIVRLPIHRKTC